MAQVVQTIDVDVPVGVSYNQWTQFESFPKFLSFVESIDQLTDTLTHSKVKIAGAEREFDAEITEQIPDDRVAWKSVEGDVNQAGVVTFHRLDENQSRVAVQLDWEPEGFVETVGAAVGIDDRSVKGDLENFKKFIESKGDADGGWRGTV
jgi:uncharacterized membrane protein